jgi:hypothetical protein
MKNIMERTEAAIVNVEYSVDTAGGGAEDVAVGFGVVPARGVGIPGDIFFGNGLSLYASCKSIYTLKNI